MMAWTTTHSAYSPSTVFATDRIAALAFGAFILFAGAPGANATGATASAPQPRINLFTQASARESSSKSKPAAVASAYRAQDNIVAKLGRLRDGWAGPGTLAPTEAIQDDVAVVISALKMEPDEIPEVHVDDDGSTSLLWSFGVDQLLSLEFFGRGIVACTYAHKDVTRSRFERFRVQDDVSIIGFIEAVMLEGLVADSA